MFHRAAGIVIGTIESQIDNAFDDYHRGELYILLGQVRDMIESGAAPAGEHPLEETAAPGRDEAEAATAALENPNAAPDQGQDHIVAECLARAEQMHVEDAAHWLATFARALAHNPQFKDECQAMLWLFEGWQAIIDVKEFKREFEALPPGQKEANLGKLWFANFVRRREELSLAAFMQDCEGISAILAGDKAMAALAEKVGRMETGYMRLAAFRCRVSNY